MARLIRVLVYEGTTEALQEVLKSREVKGSFKAYKGIPSGPVMIREAIVGDFLEEFDTPWKEPSDD